MKASPAHLWKLPLHYVSPLTRPFYSSLCPPIFTLWKWGYKWEITVSIKIIKQLYSAMLENAIPAGYLVGRVQSSTKVLTWNWHSTGKLSLSDTGIWMKKKCWLTYFSDFRQVNIFLNYILMLRCWSTMKLESKYLRYAKPQFPTKPIEGERCSTGNWWEMSNVL